MLSLEITKSDIFFCGAFVGLVLGMALGVLITTKSWQAESVRRGFAEYADYHDHKEWEWKISPEPK